MSHSSWGLHSPHDPEFAKFYHDAVPRLIAFLRYDGASYAVAADCVQDTMARAMPPRWETLREPYAWCRKVCRNSYLKRVERAREDPVWEIDGVGRAFLPSGDELRTVEEENTIAVLLMRLAPKRRAVMAFVLDGAPYCEIAEALDMPENTVRSTYRYARSQLHAMLREEGTGDADVRR